MKKSHPTMIRELDRVILKDDLPEYGLLKGDIGTIVLDHHGEGYEVEFIALDGETVGVVSVHKSQVRSVGPGEIANARPMAFSGVEAAAVSAG